MNDRDKLIEAMARDDRVLSIVLDKDFWPPDEIDVADLMRAALDALLSPEEVFDGMVERAWINLPLCEPDISRGEIAKCLRAALRAEKP